MRFLVKVLVVLAILWSGAWALGSFAITNGINAALDNLRAQGWQVQADTTKGGFPLSITTTLSDVELVHPETQDRLAFERSEIKAAPYWPGHVDVALPTTPIIFGSSFDEIQFTADQGISRLRLRPGLDLELSSSALTTGAWTLNTVTSQMLRGDGMLLVANQSAAGSGRYDVTFTVEGLAIGSDPRREYGLPDALPETFDTLTASGAVVFDAPLDRTSSQIPPKFTQIILDGARIDWGGIALRAMGALDVDPDGVPQGRIELQAQDWRNLLDLAQSAGVLPADRRGQAELMFGLLASSGGSRDNLDLPLTFEDGRMALGPLPLGPAPRFVLP